MGIIVNNLSTAGASAANDIGNASGGTTGEKINSLLPSASTSGAGKVQLASTGEQNLSKVPRATGAEIASILTAGGYSIAPASGLSSLDNIADGTSYKRVQAALADAINGGTFDAAKVTAYGIGGTVDKGAIDVNTLTTNGIYKINGGSHCPGGLGWGNLIVATYLPTYLVQLYVPIGSLSSSIDCLYMRRMENGAWIVPPGAEAGTGWYKIWGVGNDGNGGLAPQAKGTLYTVSAPTSTVITVATLSAADAAYLVRVYMPGTPTANYTAFAIIMTSSNSSASIKLQNDGVNLTISLSGMNIQVWQNSGITQTIYAVIQQVLRY